MVFARVGDETQAAAIYGTRDGEYNVHLVEPPGAVELFVIPNEDAKNIEGLMWSDELLVQPEAILSLVHGLRRDGYTVALIEKPRRGRGFVP